MVHEYIKYSTKKMENNGISIVMENLLSMNGNFSLPIAIEIFGRMDATHLYNKWCSQPEPNILYFYSTLDSMNKQKFCKYLHNFILNR